MYSYKVLRKTIYIFLCILISCVRSDKTTPQIQALILTQQYHTHDIIIYYEDVRNNRDDYYTTETLGHRHKVVIDWIDKEKLLLGLTIEKETEETLGHKHKITIKVFDY